VTSTASSDASAASAAADAGIRGESAAPAAGQPLRSPTPHGLDRRLDTALVAGGGLLLLLVLSGQMYVWINLWPLRIDWLTAVAWSIPQALVWSLTIPVVDRLVSRIPIRADGAVWRLALHVVGSVAVALLVLGTLDVSDRLLGWTLLLGAPGTLVSSIDKTILHVHIGIAVYWVVLAANHARHYYRRLADRELSASRLEALLSSAQLSALRMQLDPHFLFNTLNSIGVLMRRDVDGAGRMLAQLSDFLRGTLQHSGANEVSLRTELDYVRAYLEIERIRFGQRLTSNIVVEPGLDNVAVPYLILQPLVENALRHGIAKRSAQGEVRVEARSVDSSIELIVRDNGVGLTRGHEVSGLGVGLANVVARLRHTYGTDQRFELRNADAGGVEAIITIPRHPFDGPAASRGVE
jgi:signal transduction histidine kinase